MLLASTLAQNRTLPNTIDKSKYLSYQLEAAVTMYYLVDTVNSEIEIAMECQCTGYVAWGISTSGFMINSDVIIGWVIGENVSVFDFTIGGNRIYACGSGGGGPGVCPDTDPTLMGEDNVLVFNGSESNGVTQILFRRKLNTGDSIDIPITNSVQTVVYSFQDIDGPPPLVQHSISPKPTPVGINFFTGAVTKKIDLQLVHGSLMFIAWYCISPFGFFLARFMKGFSWWFQVHRAIMLVAMCTQIAAFGVIVSETAKGNHFNDAHKIIGLIVVILGTSQPFIGFLADKFFNPERKATPIFPDKTHWVIGWVSITLGMINIVLGMNQYGKTANGVYVVYIIFAVLTFAFCVGFAVFRLIKPSKSAH